MEQVDTSKPYVGFLDLGSLGNRLSPGRYQVRLITQKEYGPVAQVLGGHDMKSHAESACRRLHEVLGVQNANQLKGDGLMPSIPWPWQEKRNG